MPRIVLVDCFVSPAVEDEIVLVILEASGGAEDAGGDGLFVDSCCDGKVAHGFHLGGAELDEGCLLPWCVEIGR